MEQTMYRLNWSSALAPDMSFIPGAEIFEVACQATSLTALSSEHPGLLFVSPDTLIAHITSLNESQSTSLNLDEEPLISSPATHLSAYPARYTSLLSEEDVSIRTDETDLAIA